MIAYTEKAHETPSSDSYRLSAELLAHMGRYDEAIANVNRAIALDPNSPEAHRGKANILNAFGHAGEAEQRSRQRRGQGRYGRKRARKLASL